MIFAPPCIQASLTALRLSAGILLCALSTAVDAQGTGGVLDTQPKRMLVLLKKEAVARQTPLPTDTVASLFPDQRVYANPAIWSAVSLKTAGLVRDLETSVAAKAFLAFGNVTHGFAARLNRTQIDALRSDPRVEDVVEDVPGQLASVAPPPWADSPAVVASTLTVGSPTIATTGWNLKAINLYNSGGNDTPAYRTSGGYPVKAYVIDTGLQPHVDLNFNWQTDHISFDCHDNVGGNCTASTPSPTNPGPIYVYTDSCGSHGTYVAGVIGAYREVASAVGIEGVAPGAQLKSVRVTNECGGGTMSGGAYTSGVIAAINWIAAQVPNNGFDAQGRRRLSAVANMSIVWPLMQTPVPPGQPPIPNDPNQGRYFLPDGAAMALTSAITAAVNVGVFFSFAAGNSNEPACNIYPGAIGTTLPGAMSVGAIQANGGAMDLRPAEERIASSGPCVEIWAPGRDVHSSVAYVGGDKLPGAWGFALPLNSYQPGQHYYAPRVGSSLAAPHVAGAALLVARKFQLAGQLLPAPADIETIIKSRTKYFGTWDPLGWFPNPADKRIDALTVDNL